MATCKQNVALVGHLWSMVSSLLFLPQPATVTRVAMLGGLCLCGWMVELIMQGNGTHRNNSLSAVYSQKHQMACNSHRTELSLQSSNDCPSSKGSAVELELNYCLCNNCLQCLGENISNQLAVSFMSGTRLSVSHPPQEWLLYCIFQKKLAPFPLLRKQFISSWAPKWAEVQWSAGHVQAAYGHPLVRAGQDKFSFTCISLIVLLYSYWQWRANWVQYNNLFSFSR